MGVIIETPQFQMKITLVAIESLFIHEETIPTALEQLKKELIDEQVLKHPIIVDSETLVVLDGMHRVAALKELNYPLTAVCFVDYQNPTIEIFPWFREFDGKASVTEFAKLISSKLSIDITPTPLDHAFEAVNSRNAIAALAKGENVVLLNLNTPRTIKEIYDDIAKIEMLAKDIGFKLIYSVKSDALNSLQSAIRSVLIVPSLTKNEVIDGALKKEIFTQKTTRHVIPARPLFVNVPLHWLKQSDLTSANQKLKQHLETKQIVKKESGAIINGRRYEECSYIFTDTLQ